MNILIDKIQDFMLFYLKNKEVSLDIIIDLNKICKQ